MKTLPINSFASLVDAVMRVKESVYDKKIETLETLSVLGNAIKHISA